MPEYNQEEFKRLNLTIDGIPDDDEEYEENNYLDLTQFFEGLNKDVNPIDKFWNYIRLSAPDITSVSEIYLAKSDAEELKRLLELWFRGFHGRHMLERRVQTNVGMYWLDQSPAEFSPEAPEWVEEGRVYLRTRN